MGLFPTESRDVVGLTVEDGYEPYRVPAYCSVPGCTHYSDHAHHLFSRGKMGGAFDYVRVPDGTEIGNLVPLCYRHHQEVTENKAHIVYRNGRFFWEGEPLVWQPPIIKRGDIVPDLPVFEHVAEERVTERPVCPTCHRLLPKPKLDTPLEPKKIRRTWAVSVPYTHEENGADTLDALLEAAREEMDTYGLNWGDGNRVKFHILATAMALFVQHARDILSDD